MKGRLLKECRSLLLPWVVAALGGGLAPLGGLVHGSSLTTQAIEGVAGIATFAFAGGLALIAATSLGAEFQQRTLPLLLAQPTERSCIWRDKMLAVVLAITTAVSVPCLTLAPVYLYRLIPPQAFPGQQCLLIGALLLATVCSTSYWTMVARSTIGGLVFSVTMQFFVAIVAVSTLHQIYGEDLAFDTPVVSDVIVLTGLSYSAVLLYLGWRKFARLELRDAVFGEGIELPGAAGGTRWWSAWLVCRPRNNTLNLVRKELRLQKPLFVIAAVFSVCWFVTLGLHRLWPERGYYHLFEVLLGFYVPLALLLAGCVTLGEEKTLGVAGWHLTFPRSARRLWFVKLVMATATGLLLGFALPFLLLWLAITTDPSNQLFGGPIENSGWMPLLFGEMLLLPWLTILLSFWAITLVANTIRAVLTALVGLGVGGACVSLGIWGAQGLAGSEGGQQAGLLTKVMTHFQLSPIAIVYAAPGVVTGCLCVAGGLWVWLLLGQSLAQFRRTESTRQTAVKYSFILGAILFACAFWAVDFISSADGLYRSEPIAELETALRSLMARTPVPVGQTPQSVDLSELERNSNLSDNTKAWIRNALITYQATRATPGGQFYLISIMFPKGERFEFGFVGPLTSSSRWAIPRN